MHLSTILTALTLASSVSAGFANSCSNCRLIINKAVAGYMVCDCKRTDGSTNTNADIHLGRCFGNNNGDLVPQLDGNFVHSCTVDALSPAAEHAWFLSVGCPRNDGSRHSYAVNLNAVGDISNNNGNLQCYGVN
ncbi:hypothetical protein BDV95DRAFT_608009 [Massariosphaeria phaeospora]|uniref:Cyanovirin-N domain-containing protein n=1 Tax=Massariosphaeria phaeospora TaxID=100035 RepID=A0A7C8I9S7_9PLEO|nr:hypothetical protein BDV95DRAFT_608009 [Massariosphaeria phaeospora]